MVWGTYIVEHLILRSKRALGIYSSMDLGDVDKKGTTRRACRWQGNRLKTPEGMLTTSLANGVDVDAEVYNFNYFNLSQTYIFGCCR